RLRAGPAAHAPAAGQSVAIATIYAGEPSAASGCEWYRRRRRSRLKPLLQNRRQSRYIIAMGASAFPHFLAAGAGWRWWPAAVATARPQPREMSRDLARRVPAIRR